MQKPVKRSTISVIILICIALGIRLYASRSGIVESSYTSGIYPYISAFLRIVFGRLPFSAGDVLYSFLFLFTLWKTTQWVKRRRKEKRSWIPSKTNLLKILRFSLLLYIVFNLMWGLNYNRKGIHYQMNFEPEQYSQAELVHINNLLLEKVNQCKAALIQQNIGYPSTKELFAKTNSAFTQAAKKYPFLQYTHPSVKSSLFNFTGNYFGFSGYYNPFTGEAQVNTDVPPFLQPYINCHEIAHQLGYAKENEASFAGYIVATASGDSLFMYSAYFDLFLYANRNLYSADSVAAKDFLALLHPAVKEDIATLKAYYKKYENPAEPLFTWVYGKYLEANNQPLGMTTYSEVVADVIAYYKKYGEIGG
ncbi:DUF3810 domain-containing protein [Agriterribacter sp.]|uniref:DUF3810 domain-containing protein n=1 Tax=Agriterribacter sp. TaxID=2821509 RepID=UPI002BCED722|nr:DUF3810 domain-containing protein [Agriterribacter sp.]HTN08923.1 DUF3810 domain-containing protein [Agriterribacter sp.]